MRTFFIPLIILGLFTAPLTKAQTKVTGLVTDLKGHPLHGVAITLLGTYDGTITDSTGQFAFVTLEKGDKIVEAKIMGYTIKQEKVVLGTALNALINLHFELREEVSELKAVSVTAGSFAAGDKKRAATVLSALDMYTTGGANADVTASIKTLPGAQQVGEQEGLFVRGGEGYETKQYIDGMVVNNPYYASSPGIAARGRFAPSLFKGNVFSTGGYSAIYGQALSSVLLLESVDLPEKSEVSASITSVFLGAGTQQLTKNKKASYGFNYGYTNLTPYFALLSQKPDYFMVPQFQTADANFRVKTKSGGMIKYYSTFGTNQLGIRNADIDSLNLKDAFQLKNINWYNNITWRENLGKGWKLNAGFSFAVNNDKIHQQLQDADNHSVVTGMPLLDAKSFQLNNQQSYTQFRAVFEKKLTGLSVIRMGTDYWYNHQNLRYNNNTSIINNHYNAYFAEADVHVTNNLAAKIGSRAEYTSLIQRWNWAPRLALALKTGKHAQMSAAYGIFYQTPENNYFIQYSAKLPQLNYMKATHYLVNYIKTTNLQTFRIEAYYKQYQQLVKTIPDTVTNGYGFAKGIELFWRDKKTFKNFDYWISYSYLNTERNYLNYPQTLQPGYTTPHTFNLVTKKFITSLKTGFNFTYTFATGRPYYNIQSVNTPPKYVLADEGKTPAYHNLGFSLNYLPNLGKPNAKNYVVWVVSVTNLLNNTQTFGYHYSANGMNKVAIHPPIKQFFFIGCFLSWGVDRSQDAINNNL